MSTQQSAKTQYVKAPNGVAFAYRQIGNASGIPLLLLTHFRGTMDKWDPLIVNSLAKNRRVITVDYAGVGLSTGEVATSIRQSAADITQFIELIGGTEIDLLGFSIGGYVAQMVALNADPSKVKVRKLILAGTGTSYGPELIYSQNKDVGSVAGVKDVDINVFKTLFFPKNAEGDAAAEAWWSRIHERNASTSGEEASLWLSSGYRDGGKGLMGQVTQGHDFTESREKSKGEDGAYDRLLDLKIPVLIANGSVSDLSCSFNQGYMLTDMFLTERLYDPHAQQLPYLQQGPQRAAHFVPR
jgi:pimeloyl-ACP methyl ester carboxylesterase